MSAEALLVVGLQSLTIILLFTILVGTFKNMASLKDLQDDLQDIADAVVVLADEIKALKEAGAGLVSQEQLDALDAKAELIKAALAAAQ